VNVAAGDPTTETNVQFWNATEFGYNKVCKALDSANSDALAGDEFWFDYSVALSTGGTESGSVGVYANTFEQGPACQFINDGFPLGSVITITEDPKYNVDASRAARTVTVPGTWNPNGYPGNNITRRPSPTRLRARSRSVRSPRTRRPWATARTRSSSWSMGRSTSR